MRTPADDGSPLFVPTEFEAEHLDDARRAVIRSLVRRGRVRSLGERAIGPRRGWRSIAVIAHLTAVTIALVFAAVTGTWAVGFAVIASVVVSLPVSLPVLSSIERKWADLQ